MKVFPYVVQQSEEWMRLRKGRPTASNFDKIITAKTGEMSKSARGYAIELLAECFCPEFVSFFGTPWTDRGQELEDEARKEFIRSTGLGVEQVGFCSRDDGIVGCSPDGLIRDMDGNYVSGLELKCPAPKTHVEYVLGGVLPDDYKQQVHGGMAVTGLNEWHFFSHFPGMKPFHIIVPRDAYTEKLSAALDEFLVLYADIRKRGIPKLQIKQEGAAQ